MQEDYVFSIIGRLYVDLYSAQKVVQQLQAGLASKEQEINVLRNEVKSHDVEPQWTTEKKSD